ncbi:MAG: UDP-glucuronosyltransferase [Proteobacteria bacterium]|nr:UDP-glucuronosyltransferase [Pseudomonadota bacterium]
MPATGSGSGGSSVLYAWEFGANLGHIGTFLPVARALRQRGTRVHWAVAHPQQAVQLLPAEGFAWFQAPCAPETPREGPPLNYADILLRFGYAHALQLLATVVPWRELIRASGAQLVLADHAPTAILAARTLDIPVMLFGGGFFAPPRRHPTPNMRPWAPIPESTLLAIDAQVIPAINGVLHHFGKPRVTSVADLFDVAEDSLLTFPELDHYAERGPARYWGTLPAAVAAAPHWPDAPGPRVYAYLRPETPHCHAALASLHRLAGSVLVFAPGLPAAVREQYAAPHLHFASGPVDLTTAAQQADAAVTYASPAATIAFLMAGKPILMVPGHLEQYLFARRVEEIGAGLVLNMDQPADQLPGLLQRLLGDTSLAANAAGFARKYAHFDQGAVITHIADRIGELARG